MNMLMTSLPVTNQSDTELLIKEFAKIWRLAVTNVTFCDAIHGYRACDWTFVSNSLFQRLACWVKINFRRKEIRNSFWNSSQSLEIVNMAFLSGST